jgi:hypothetical protein
VFGIRDWPRDLPVPSRTCEETERGREIHEVLVEKSTRRCTHRTQRLRPDGSCETYELIRVHYTLQEVHTLLARAHFQLINAYHAFDRNRPYGAENEGLVIVAQRTSDSERPKG